MKGDRVEAVVDTGNGTRTFEIVATRAGRRLEVTTARGIVEVTEVTRSGNPVRTGRFMANRLIALVEYPALESDGSGVEVSTRRRMGAGTRSGGGQARRRGARNAATTELDSLLAAEASEPDPVDEGATTDRPDELARPDPADLVRSAEGRS
jgi:hypothetical protein